jgi:hypothetical protein
MIEIIKQYIFKFQEQIQHFNGLLKKKYEFNTEPTYNDAGNIFPKKGELIEEKNIYHYQYHGSGCTIIKNEIWINYNIDILNNNEITITAWDIKKFIETLNNCSSPYKSSEINQVFLKLEEEKILKRREEEFMIFNIVWK